MATINYDDKVALNENSSIADINKVNASDMNLIKEVVNENANTLDNLLSNVYGTSNENGYTQEYVNGIIESGSNANGNYVKYADGTMICYKSDIQYDVNITNQYEGVYFYSTGNIYFPQQFTSTPTVNISLRGLAGGGYSCYTVNTELFEGFVWKTASKSNATFWLYYIAIGRWK